MNTNSTFDEVDDYVDALLGGAIEPIAAVPTAVSPVPPGEAVPVAPDFNEPAFEEPAVEKPAIDKPSLNEPAIETPAFGTAASYGAPIDCTPREAPRIETRAVEMQAASAPEKPPVAPVRDIAAFAQNIASNVATATSPRAGAPIQTSHRWLRVAIGSDSYALELLCVQEVVRVAPIVAMRGANHAVLGVMNLRGRIVPVFDLGLWLGTACVRPDERSRIVVVEREDELIGVLVTLVEDVVTLPQHRIEPPLPGSAAGPIVGVARVGATPTVLLDAGALFGG